MTKTAPRVPASPLRLTYRASAPPGLASVSMNRGLSLKQRASERPAGLNDCAPRITLYFVSEGLSLRRSRSVHVGRADGMERQHPEA